MVRNEQVRIKNEFLSGPRYRESDGTMNEFCEKQLRKLIHLDKPLDDVSIIDALERKPPGRIQDRLAYGLDEGIGQLFKFVDKLDHKLWKKQGISTKQS